MSDLLKDDPRRDKPVTFYCVVCKAMRTRFEVQASYEIGGWACAFHTSEELAAVRDPDFIFDREGNKHERQAQGTP